MNIFKRKILYKLKNAWTSRYTTQPNLYINTPASTPAKVNPKSPLTAVETAPPPLEGDPVLVGEVPPDAPDLVDEPAGVDEGEPVLEGGWP